MKQAKLALTAVAVLAVVGGALAFKASRTTDVNLYTASIVDGKTYCSVPAIRENATLQSGPGTGATFTTVASLSPNTLVAPCPTITLKVNQ
ncbi:hypothetical protein [Chitinophaga polysaccharea]|uniref:hypothetical protein n=1 Tax=Chitinophaga polysaccharea TaxID=1293035 RepID=UPI001158AD97|nr:hypothetical protein [Chitinophaga polysaccharea]